MDTIMSSVRDVKVDTLHPEKNCQVTVMQLLVPAMLLMSELNQFNKLESEVRTLMDLIPSSDMLLRLRMTSNRRLRAV